MITQAPLMLPDSQERTAHMCLVRALATPGQAQYLVPQSISALSAFLLIGQTILKHGGYFTPDADLADILARTTAHKQPAETARCHFYPRLTTENLAQLNSAPTGPNQFPEDSTTVIIGCDFKAGYKLVIEEATCEQPAVAFVNNVPAAFWSLRQQKMGYPSGWDVFLVETNRVIGIPRTATVTVH